MKKELLKVLNDLEYYNKARPKKVSDKFGLGNINVLKKQKQIATDRIRELCFLLAPLYKRQKNTVSKILTLALNDDLDSFVPELRELVQRIEFEDASSLSLDLPRLPADINANISADFREIEKTFNSGCFRASTILCGRILEISLHRKYYETTGVDILEKNPGIGLGKLIAKLSDKGVFLDPGITQQIHLVNQIRIHSVHVKKDAFNPTKQQAYAMILYTLDIVEKLFKN